MTWRTEGRSLPGLVEVIVGELRKVSCEREARRWLAAVRCSGLTVGEWARARGVDGRSLRAWDVNLARRTGGGSRRAKGESRARATTARLVELVPAARSLGRYTVQVGSATVEFGDDFAAETLRRVVAVLRSC